jgi:hypothetical protein
VSDVIASPGRPLDASTRSLMEPRLGHDFSQVRVHTDDRAAESARAVGANAYTAGNHLAFGAGKYAPGTQEGQQLMAHELTHVVQQDSGPVSGTPVGDGLSISHPTDQFERQAKANANLLNAHPDNLPSAAPPPTRTPNENKGIHLQRDDLDTAASLSGGFGGGLSGIAAIIGLNPAFRSAKATERQADIAQKAYNLSENPPVAAPLTGGIVVNNNAGYDPIPAATAPITTAPKPKAKTTEKEKPPTETEKPVSLLKVSQGPDNFATFNAFIKTNQKDITGGFIQDGESQGYLGGSGASNLNLTLKPTAAAPPPAPKEPDAPPKEEAPKKAEPTPKKGSAAPKKAEAAPQTSEVPPTPAAVRFLISGNNIAPRTGNKGATIQRFSGSVAVDAKGVVTVSHQFSHNPGTLDNKGSGDGDPAVKIDLPLSSPAGASASAATPAPAPAPQKGTPPK